jgi:hypothetical protein
VAVMRGPTNEGNSGLSSLVRHSPTTFSGTLTLYCPPSCLFGKSLGVKRLSRQAIPGTMKDRHDVVRIPLLAWRHSYPPYDNPLVPGRA